MVPAMRTPRLILPAAAVLAAFLLAACGGEGGAAADVATLGGASADPDDTEGGGQGGRAPDPEFQDAMVEFAECMREHGIDMPDPQSDGNGFVVVEAAPAGRRPSPSENEEMEAADEACKHILDDVAGSFRPDPEQEAEMREQALEFAECMREHGVDFPDPQFGDNGDVTVGIGGPDAGGIDPNDDDFQEAQEACGGPGGGFVIGAGAAVGDGGEGGAGVVISGGAASSTGTDR